MVECVGVDFVLIKLLDLVKLCLMLLLLGKVLVVEFVLI